MKNKNKESKAASHNNKEEEFKGYTIDELRYQIALLALKKEFMKEKALANTQAVKEQIPMLNGKSPLSAITPRGIMGKIVKGLSFSDYFLLGLQALMIGKKVTGIFKRSK